MPSCAAYANSSSTTEAAVDSRTTSEEVTTWLCRIGAADADGQPGLEDLEQKDPRCQARARFNCRAPLVGVDKCTVESSFTLLRVRGIPIGAHWSWLFIFALVAWSLATALFPSTYPGLEGSAYLAMALVAAVLFFGSILLHEMGHALRALDEGMPIEGITLWLLGGVARLGGSPHAPGAEFRVAIAGPLVTIALAAAFGATALVGGSADFPDPVQGVVDYLARINLLVLAFNLVPALPLDGGRVLRAWLWRRQRSFVAATRSAARAGQAFGAVLIAVGLLDLISGPGVGGVWLAFVGWFLVQAAQSEATMAQVRQALRGVPVRDVMTPDPRVISPHVNVAEFVDMARPHRVSTYPVVDGDELVGLVSLKAAAGVAAQDRERKRVREIMTPVSAATTVGPDQDVFDALSRFEGGRRALVVDDGRLVGVVSASDVTRAVDIERARGGADEPGARRSGVLVWVVVGLVIVGAGAALYHPPYVVIAPGEAANVLDDVDISGVETDEVTGRYLLTSVKLSRPSALRTVIAALRRDRQVVPLSEALPQGVGAEEYFRAQRAVFAESRMLAAAAAAEVAGMPVSVSGTGARIVQVLRDSPAADELRAGDVVVEANGEAVDDAISLRQLVQSRPAGDASRLVVEREGGRTTVTVRSRNLPSLSGGVGLGVLVETRDLRVDLPFDIRFVDRDVGGPSAGLAYALAIYDSLSQPDEARGRTIAATGTVDLDGDVGPVGGIPQKALAAEQAGADLFLVPVSEVEQARDVDLRVQGVTSLHRARALLSANG